MNINWNAVVALGIFIIGIIFNAASSYSDIKILKHDIAGLEPRIRQLEKQQARDEAINKFVELEIKSKK